MNPFSICYNNTNIENVVKYAGAGAIFVADFDNLDRPEFQIAREKGAELYAYRRPISVTTVATGPRELAYYMGDVKNVPLWGGGRRNNDYSHFTDLRVGSAWVDWMVEDMGRLITEGVCDGALLDVLGARPWGKLSDWANWPAGERAEWTAGSVDALRRMHEERNRVDERFELVCNNIWDLSPKGDPSDELANTGNMYCNGICIEHRSSDSAYHRAYAARTFGALPRRVLALATSIDEALAWAAVPGVTHVCPQMQYAFAEPPVVPFEDTRLAEASDYIERLKARSDPRVAELETALAAATAALAQSSAELTVERVAREAAITELAGVRSAWQSLDRTLRT